MGKKLARAQRKVTTYSFDGLRLPLDVMTCGLCKGHGQYMQRWCDAGRSMGACDGCCGAQFRYESTMEPVPASVREQIKNENELVEDWINGPPLGKHASMVKLCPPGREGLGYICSYDELTWLFAAEQGERP